MSDELVEVPDGRWVEEVHHGEIAASCDTAVECVELLLRS